MDDVGASASSRSPCSCWPGSRDHGRRRRGARSSRPPSCPARWRWSAPSPSSGSTGPSCATSSISLGPGGRGLRPRGGHRLPPGRSSWAPSRRSRPRSRRSPCFGAYLPIPALVPLTLSLFGTGEMQKIIFLALAFSHLPAAPDRGAPWTAWTTCTSRPPTPSGPAGGRRWARSSCPSGVAGHLPGPAHGVRRGLELHPPGRDGGHRQGRRRPHHHLAAARPAGAHLPDPALSSSSWPSSRTSSGPRSERALFPYREEGR